jgi:hypothetical protein
LAGLTKKQVALIVVLLLLAVVPRLFLEDSGKKSDLSPVVAPPSARSLMDDADQALLKIEEILAAPPQNPKPDKPKVDDILQSSLFPEQVAGMASGESSTNTSTTTSTFVTTTSTLPPVATVAAEKLAPSVESVSLIKAYEEKLKLLEESNALLKSRLEEQRIQSQKDKVALADLSAEESRVRKSLEQQLEVAVRNKDEQVKENEKLKRIVDDFEKRIKLIEEQRLADSAAKDRVLLKQVADLRKELSSVKAAFDEHRKKSKSLESERDSAKSRADNLLKELESRQAVLDELNIRLAEAEKAVEESKSLRQELALTKSELLLAKEQVQAVLSTPVRRTGSVTSAPVSAPRGDVVTVEVIVPKATLRTGPGEEHSSLMEIQRGSILVVEAREGEWLRVVSPKGQRAYIRSDLAVELDATGRPRFSQPAPVRPPLAKKPPEVLAPAPTFTPLPTAIPQPTVSSEEEEREAFEALRKGMTGEN